MKTLNDRDSTNGICDECAEPIEKCECDIICGKCEDGMPRRHTCAEDPEFCDFCKEPMDECECKTDYDD